MADPKALVVPPLGESITEAVIGKWHVAVGDPIGEDENVVELETDKVSMQIPAPVSGVLLEQKYEEGDTVKIGDIVGAIDPKKISKKVAKKAAPAATAKAAVAETSAPAAKKPAAAAAPSKASAIADADLARLTPSQRRTARMGGDIASVHGIAVDDVQKMSPLRKRIAERLVQAQHESASLTTFNEIDMGAVMELRASYKEDFLKRHGVKLGFMSFFVKAAVAAAKEFPGINAEIVDDSIIYRKRYDFGIAVSTPKGLVVPVLRHVDKLSFAEVELGIGELAAKARDGRLSLDDLVGGTFTITNGGIYGSMMSTPLLNYPQTGILGMHNIVKRPMVVGDEIKVRPMMYAALTYDHRVVDGKQAVSFLVSLKRRIENPERLMFDV